MEKFKAVVLPVVFTVLYGLLTAWRFVMAHRRNFAIGGGAAVVLLGAWIFWPASSPSGGGVRPADQLDREQVVKFMGSDDFAKQPDSIKIEYADRLMKLGRPPGSRPARGEGQPPQPPPEPTAEEKKLHENMRVAMEARMRKEMQDYFALSEKDRVAYLDQRIDSWMSHRPPEPESRPADAPPPPEATSQPTSRPGEQRRQGGFSMQRMKEHMESTSPQDRAMREEFMRQMRKRMEERGIKPGGGSARPPR